MNSILLAGIARALPGLAAPKPEAIVLMLDEKCVSASEGIRFHLNPAKKHPENPVLLPGEPHQWDSLQVAWPGTVLYSAREGKFRCWYAGLDALQKDRDANIWRIGYAESDDGIHWRKPDLEQVTQDGRRTNQLRPWSSDSYAPSRINFVFENPFPDAPPSQRFGADWLEKEVAPSGPKGRRRSRRRFAWSPDGIHWTPADLAHEMGDNVPFDWHQVLPDDPNRRFVAFVEGKMQPRSWDGRRVRQVGFLRGPGVETIPESKDAVLLTPEQGIDEEIHFSSASLVGDTIVMLFDSDRFANNPIHGDIRLAISTDGGRHFRRVHPRDAVVSTGAKGMWDENLLVVTSSALQEVGDEIYIYYFGCPNVFNSWPEEYAAKSERRGSLLYPTYLGLATLPRDRYAYAAGAGTLTTHPISIGDAVWLNAHGDALEVTALDGSRKEAVRGRLGRERSRTIYRKVVWAGSSPLGNLRLRIRLSGSDKIYSIRCT